MKPESSPLSVERCVEEACDRFELGWKNGQRPRIEEYLAKAPEPERRALLRALLALEIELRSEGGERPTPDEYEQRWPDQRALIEAVFAEALALDGSGQAPGNGGPSPKHQITPLSPESPPPFPDPIGRYTLPGDL